MTPSAVGWTSCSRSPGPLLRLRPAGHRGAGVFGSAASAQADWVILSRSSCGPESRPTWTRSSGDWSTSRTPGPTWSPSGAWSPRSGAESLDVFPPTEEHPLRVEFWGDEVEEIRRSRGGPTVAHTWRSVDCAAGAARRELLLTEDALWPGGRTGSSATLELAEMLGWLQIKYMLYEGKKTSLRVKNFTPQKVPDNRLFRATARPANADRQWQYHALPRVHHRF